MRFANWELLSLFLLFPVIIYFYLVKRPESRVLYSAVGGLSELSSSSRLMLRHLPFVLRLVATALWIIALARPQAGHTLKDVQTEGVDIILTLDTSNSMEARDLEFQTKQRTRLEVAKEVVADFIKKRPNDRLGLVVFGENAFTQCPLTLDHGVLLSFLQQIDIGHAGGQATAIGDALGTSVKRLKDLKAKSKVIILLTDGRNNHGDMPPKQAAEIAKTFNIKIYSVGVGSHGKAPFFEDDPFFGRRVRYEDVDIDEAGLKQIATYTNGQYFRAKDTEGLQKIYDIIDKLEKVDIKVTEHMEYNEKAIPFIIAGLIILLLEILLSGTLARRVP